MMWLVHCEHIAPEAVAMYSVESMPFAVMSRCFIHCPTSFPTNVFGDLFLTFVESH